MLKSRISDKFYKAVSLLALCCIVGILAMAYASVTPESPRWDDDFYQIDEDYPGFTEQSADNNGDKIHIYSFSLNYIPKGGQMFSVWAVHRDSRIYIGDELVYDSINKEQNRLSKSPGCYWALVPVDITDSGKNVRVEMKDAYKSLLAVIPNMYLCTQGQLLAWCLSREWIMMTVGILCILLCIIYALLAVLLHANHDERIGVLCTAMFIGIFGLFRLSDSPLVTLVFNRHAQFLTFLSRLCYCWIIPVFYMSESKRNPQRKIYRALYLFFFVLALIFTLLQAFGIKDLREMINIVIVLLFVAFIAVIGEHIYILIKKDHKKENLQAFILHLLVVMGCIADVLMYINSRHSLLANFTLYVVLIYGIFSGVGMTRKILNRNKLITAQKIEIADQRSALMLSQMQPHFVYNTMNTIYALCDTDIDDAKKAIHAFSGFLRHNLGSMERKTPVPFETELEHTKFYLSIEKLRFGDELNVIYDIQETEFDLPPISIQPIVENAVRHGIRHKPGGGTVTISTGESDGMYTVTVTDDGVGFDTDTLGRLDLDQEHNHIALRNVASRVEQMCDGHLEINSTPGSGTTVVISVPVKEDETR